jgi:hypothetical protein
MVVDARFVREYHGGALLRVVGGVMLVRYVLSKQGCLWLAAALLYVGFD